MIRRYSRGLFQQDRPEADLIRHFGQVRFAAPSGHTRALLDTFVRCHDLKLTINRRGASG